MTPPKTLDLRRFATLGLMVVWILVSSGCLWVESRFSPPWSDDEPQPVLPDRVLCSWTDTVLHQPGEPGIRGFGGRVFFYVDGEKDPVEVDGALIVYAFDAQAADPRNPQPEKKFVFKREDLHTHYSKNKVGHSYSFWLPWDVVGSPTRQINLVARFEGAEGGTLFSDSLVQLLPGVQPAEEETAEETQLSSEKSTGSIEQAAFTADAGGDNKSEMDSTMKSHSISVPPSFARRLATPLATGNTPAHADSLSPANRRTSPPRPMNHGAPPSTAGAKLNIDRIEPGGPSTAPRRFTPSRFPQHPSSRFTPSRMVPRRQPHKAIGPSALPTTPREATANEFGPSTEGVVPNPHR